MRPYPTYWSGADVACMLCDISICDNITLHSVSCSYVYILKLSPITQAIHDLDLSCLYKASKSNDIMGQIIYHLLSRGQYKTCGHFETTNRTREIQLTCGLIRKLSSVIKPLSANHRFFEISNRNKHENGFLWNVEHERTGISVFIHSYFWPGVTVFMPDDAILCLRFRTTIILAPNGNKMSHRQSIIILLHMEHMSRRSTQLIINLIKSEKAQNEIRRRYEVRFEKKIKVPLRILLRTRYNILEPLYHLSSVHNPS